MLVHVVEARYRGDHRVWLKFDDGLEGEVDLGSELRGEVFEHLRDKSYFCRVSCRTNADLAERRRLCTGVPARARPRSQSDSSLAEHSLRFLPPPSSNPKLDSSLRSE